MTLPVSPHFYPLTRDDGRIVYHLGSVGALPQNQDRSIPFHLGPYTEGAVDTPAQWWIARVTDRTACPISIKRTPAQIVAANRMFPYGNTGAKVAAQPARVSYSYMGSSNVTKSMGTTGERGDIGLITNNSAYFMLGASPLPMIDWALVAESIPVHFRDEATGKPVDLLKYPAANKHAPAKQGSPNLPIGPLVTDSDGVTAPTAGGDWKPQQAHYPELCYLAHMATLDEGFLEELQYHTNMMFMLDAYISNIRKIATIYGELRGIAWSFRNLFMAHIATKDAEVRYTAAGKAWPDYLHPSSYYKTLLDNQLSYYTAKYMNDPNNQVFRLVSGGYRFSPWMADYMLTALAFGVLTGHSDWVPLYLWALKNAIEVTKGGSYLQECYPPGWGRSYRLNCYEWAKNPDGTWNKDEFDLTKPLNWWTAFLYLQNDNDARPPTQAQIDTLKADPLNGGVAMQGQGYNMTTRAVLVMASHIDKLGLANVRQTYPELDTCIANSQRMHVAHGSVNARVSVVDTLPPAPPPKPPNHGDIFMSLPALNAKFTATVHFLDDAEVERPVDSVDWSATGGIALDGAANDHDGVITGTYTGTGPFELQAVGHVGGNDIVVKVGGTVPVPFPTHGLIVIS